MKENKEIEFSYSVSVLLFLKIGGWVTKNYRRNGQPLHNILDCFSVSGRLTVNSFKQPFQFTLSFNMVSGPGLSRNGYSGHVKGHVRFISLVPRSLSVSSRSICSGHVVRGERINREGLEKSCSKQG